MIELFGLFWMRPWFLILVPLAVVMGLVLMRSARDLGDWERAMDPHLLLAMKSLGRVTGGAPRRAWLPALLLAVLGIALAGPGLERRDTAGYRNLDAVVLVLDLSPSTAQDPRLFEALTAARLIVESAGTRQTGLVVYAGEAYVAAPLTTDPRAMDGMLALIDGQTMPVEGTAPKLGLDLAGQMLSQAQILAADVVVISDGGGIDPKALSSAGRLASTGATVSVLAYDPNPELDALALAGQGVLASIADPFSIANKIAERPASRLAETDYAMHVIRDFGRALLILALMGAVFLLPRRGVTE